MLVVPVVLVVPAVLVSRVPVSLEVALVVPRALVGPLPLASRLALVGLSLAQRQAALVLRSPDCQLVEWPLAHASSRTQRRRR